MRCCNRNRGSPVITLWLRMPFAPGALVRSAKAPAGYGSKRRPVPSRQRRARWPRPDSAQSERGAMLHVRYAEWYANLFKLEIAEHAWERRLASIADQSVTVSAATRRNFGAYGDRGIERVGGQGDFDHYLLVLLGLGGFSDDQEQALRADCMQFIPVKRIFRNANYLERVLALAGRSCRGVLLRLGACADRHFLRSHRSVARHRATAARSDGMSTTVANRFATKAFGSCAVCRAEVRARFSARRSGGRRWRRAPSLPRALFPARRSAKSAFVSKLAAMRLPRRVPDAPALIGYKKIIEDGMEWSRRAMTSRTMPEMR